MLTNVEDGTVIQKTRDLCKAILDDPEFQAIRRQIDAFMADENAMAQYRSLSERGAQLQHKQQIGMAPEMDEITEFQRQREAFLKNPVGQSFLDAQQAVHLVRESVNDYVSKTFELGRLPAKADFESESCGHGCGCHH